MTVVDSWPLVEVRLKKIEWCEIFCWYTAVSSQRLSEKVHATIPKRIVGGFKFTVFQRNFKEWQERPRLFASAKGKQQK